MVTIADALKDAISKYESARAAFDEITALITGHIRDGRQPAEAELRREDEARANVVLARRSVQTWFAIQTHYSVDSDEMAPPPPPQKRRERSRARRSDHKPA